MAILMIGIKLHKPEERPSYRALFEILYRYKNFNASDTMWFIDTKEPIFEVMRKIKLATPYPDNDQFMVIKQTGIWECHHFEEFTTWLDSPSRAWDNG